MICIQIAQLINVFVCVHPRSSAVNKLNELVPALLLFALRGPERNCCFDVVSTQALGDPWRREYALPRRGQDEFSFVDILLRNRDYSLNAKNVFAVNRPTRGSALKFAVGLMLPAWRMWLR